MSAWLAHSERASEPDRLIEIRKAVEFPDLFAVLDQAVHPERALAVLLDPEATLVAEAKELVVTQTAAKQPWLPYGVRVTLATLLDEGVEMFSAVGKWVTHHVFSGGG
uniref:Uncharacterized protein n=1 Tax=Bosea sp. NBC_00436 TaxID=2969620 RepID=A0A9E8CS93_9HYPH